MQPRGVQGANRGSRPCGAVWSKQVLVPLLEIWAALAGGPGVLLGLRRAGRPASSTKHRCKELVGAKVEYVKAICVEAGYSLYTSVYVHV